MNKKIDINKYQADLQKAYYKFNKNLLKQQYFDNDTKFKQLKTVSAVEGFVTYLRYLRDSLFITEMSANNFKTSEFKGSVGLNLLATAIDEYEESQSCINKYFNINFDNIASKNLDDIISVKKTDENETIEQIQNKYAVEWQQHWNRFWELAAKCIDLTIYGTTL